ncbi:unnamed protein product [Ilex paraguariensis]|uniref:Protein BREAKING OF ASYMMETRY IN THE STOMATAL LINEAGE n=1 Tax=Ilex paraguariensis TaxID=185542 RepID=A0ABC8RT54_9AQUA
MVFNPLDDNRRSETKKTASFDNKCKEEKEESVESHETQTIDDTAVRSAEKQTTDDSSWPRFAEEDYIVFCFQEDGAIHVLKDRKLEVSNHHIDRSSESSRLVSRKGEEDEERLHMDTQLAADGIKEVNHSEEIKECKMVSATSSDSNQSDGSTSSFAFPVLGLEWMESPEKMPKSEDLHSRKHKARIVRPQCCKF